MTTPSGDRQLYKGQRTRGRSADVHARVMAAARHALLHEGYEGLSLPRVADAAGVARTTVYRRWPTRSQLAADVLVDLNAEWVPTPAGTSLREQLLSIAHHVAAVLADPQTASLIKGLQAIPKADGDVLQRTLLAARSDTYDQLLDDARQRGEYETDIDAWALVESIIAPIWMRALITGAPITEPWIADLVDRTLRGAERTDAGKTP